MVFEVFINRKGRDICIIYIKIVEERVKFILFNENNVRKCIDCKIIRYERERFNLYKNNLRKKGGLKFNLFLR